LTPPRYRLTSAFVACLATRPLDLCLQLENSPRATRFSLLETKATSPLDLPYAPHEAIEHPSYLAWQPPALALAVETP
jgi:hypothetical protein